MESTPLFLRRTDNDGYDFVETGLIAQFELDAYPPAAAVENQLGALIKFKTVASTSKQVARLFRNRSLIATVNSDQTDLTQEQLFVDAGAPFGQTSSYTLEVYQYDERPKYRFMSNGYTMPSLPPAAPVSLTSTTVVDSSADTTKSVELEFAYDPQANPARNPTHFLVSVTSGADTLHNLKVEFSPYRYTYKQLVTFNVTSSTTSVTLSVAAVRGALTTETTVNQAVNQFNLLPAPVITFSDVTTRFDSTEQQIPKPSYGFKVTITMPAGLDDVDSFEIIPTSSSKYFDKTTVTPTSNTFTWDEDNLPVLTFPSFVVVAIKDDARSPDTAAQFSLTDISADILTSFLDNQEVLAKGADDFAPMPSVLGTPAMGLYYQGSTFAEWANALPTTPYVPYLRQSNEDFKLAEGSSVSNPIVMWKQEDFSALFFRTTREYNPGTVVSYSNLNNQNWYVDIGPDNLAAQQFTWTDDPKKIDGVTPEINRIKSIDIYMAYNSGPGEDLYFDIYDNYVQDGEDYPGDKISVEFGKLAGNTDSEPSWRTITFPTEVDVTFGTKYWIVAWASPTLTTYRWFGFESPTIPQEVPFEGKAASQLSNTRLKVFDRDTRLSHQGDSYRQAVIQAIDTADSAYGDLVTVSGDQVTDAPALLTNSDFVRDIDSFLSKIQFELEMEQQSYSGPCILFEAFPSAEIQTGFVEGREELVTSRVRVGDLLFNYGRRTDITRVTDVAAKINTTNLYKAVVLCNTTLQGGELTSVFEPTAYVKAIGDDPETTEAISEDNIYDYLASPAGAGDDVSFVIGGVTGASTTTHIAYDGAYIVRMAKVMARYTENTKIRILPPYHASPDVSWYPRVNIGRFSVYRNDRINEYAIAEYPFQNWSQRIGPPYRDVWSESSRVVDIRAIQLNRFPLYDVNHVHLIVNGEDWQQFISDVDVQNGVILLSKDLPDSPAISVDYIYHELSYEYPFVDLNPTKRFSQSLVGKYVGLFLAQVQKDEPATDNNLFFSDVTETQRYFGRRRTVFHRIFDSVDDLEAFANNSSNNLLFLLGYYNIGESDIRNTQIRDARRRGGGIIDNMTQEEAFQKHRGARGFYDIGYHDGEPFSECNVVIRIPQYLRERLDDERISELARKYLAYGVLPIITYYDGTHIDVSNPNSGVVFPLPDQIPAVQLLGYGVSYGEIYGLK